MSSLPWICAGDFNEILCFSEKKGENDRTLASLSDFRTAVDECDFVDLGFAGPIFTWNNRKIGLLSLSSLGWRDVLQDSKNVAQKSLALSRGGYPRFRKNYIRLYQGLLSFEDWARIYDLETQRSRLLAIEEH